MRRIAELASVFFIPLCLCSQSMDTTRMIKKDELDIKNSLFRDVLLRLDTLEYSLGKNAVLYNERDHIYFQYNQEDPVMEVHLFFNHGFSIEEFSLLPSGDFEVLEPVLAITEEHTRFKVRFKELTRSDFLKFIFQYMEIGSDKLKFESVDLFPLFETTVKKANSQEDLYIGEESIIQIESNNIHNIEEQRTWVITDDYEYKITRGSNRLNLHLIPTINGKLGIAIPLGTRKPRIASTGEFDYDYLSYEVSLSVKSSRLAFLGLNESEIVYSPQNQKEGIEIEIQDHRYLKVNHLYRLEEKESPGNPLIAELRTERRLSNNKVLSHLRPYALHNKAKGNLYVKDHETPRFLTNINILPIPKIKKVEVLRPGKDWTANPGVNPGEEIEVRISGESLHNARISIGNLFISPDSITKSFDHVVIKTKIPLFITEKKLPISINDRTTQWAIRVKEYSEARPFDYINLDYGEGIKVFSKMKRNEPYQGILDDVLVSFDQNLIDSKGFHGIQLLDIDVTLRDNRNSLVDQTSIKNIKVCPGINSPRYRFYDRKSCQLLPISINDHLRRKTYDLTDWDYVELQIRTQRGGYDNEIIKKTNLILQRNWTFDLDVSFPGGLLIKRFGKSDIDPLGGISMAMIGQFTFYEPSVKAKEKPYKAGAGFLAFNAFNFSADAENRDVAFVALGSIKPIARKSKGKLSFPLFFGGGYFLSEKRDSDTDDVLPRWFILLGPGIRVRL